MADSAGGGDKEDILGLLSECGDMPGSDCPVDELGDRPEPPQSAAGIRKYQSKVGIGFLGPPIDEAESHFGKAWLKLKVKVCCLCRKSLADPDPVNPTLVRAWGKQRHDGRVCAYCGVARLKLFPTLTTEAVLQMVDTQKEEFNRFHSFLERMISAYKSGDKAARNLNDNQHQMLDKVSSFSFETSTKGKMVLLSAYEGDPAADGRKVVRTRWKDGSIQEVVLVPYTKSTEMECEWKNATGHEHRSEVHNGDMLDDPNQLQRLYSDLRDSKGTSRFSGKEEAMGQLYMPSASSSAAPASGAESSTVSAFSLADEDESEAEDEDEGDMMDIFMDGGEQKKRPRSGGVVAGAGGGGSGGGAGLGLPKAKKAHTGAAGGGAAPPPLRGAPGAARGKAAKGKDANAGAGGGAAADKSTIAQLDKMDKMESDFAGAQRASILALDKKYFKQCKGMVDSVNSKVLTASRELRPRMALTAKTLDIIVRYIKAYTQWVKKADDNEFLVEHESLKKFCLEHPVVYMDFPQCIGYDMQEMRFGNGLMECLEKKNHEEVKKRFAYITLPALLQYKSKDEVEAAQPELVNTVILKILGNSLNTDADVTTAISKLQVFLEPVTSDDLEFVSSLFLDMALLKSVFRNDDNYEGRTKDMAERLHAIANSSNETCNIFTAMGNGRKVIQAVKNMVAEQVRKETAMQRLSGLAKDPKNTLEKLSKMDSELHGFGFQVEDGIMKSFQDTLHAFLTDACRLTRLIVQSIIGPPGGHQVPLTYTDGIPDQFADISKDMQAFDALQYLDFKPECQEKQLLDFLKSLLKAPLQVMQPKMVDIHMAAVEAIAPLLAYVRSLYDGAGDDLLKFFGTVGFDRDFLDAFVEAGNLVMEMKEAEAIAPKLKNISSLMYQDTYWEKLAESNDTDDAIFVVESEVDNLYTASEKYKGDIQRHDAYTVDANTLLSAVGKSVVATVLLLQWRLHVARMSYAVVKKHMATSWGTDGRDLPVNIQAAFGNLAKHTQLLEAVAHANNLKNTLERFPGFSEAMG